MYTQDFNPVSDSLGLTAIFAVLPILTLFVLLGGLKLKAQWAALIALAVAMAGRDDRLRHARRPDRAVGARGRGVRPLPDHVDRRHGDLDLQHDRRERAFRGPAQIVRRDLGGPAHPGRDHRLLLRRADGGARRLRHACRDHRGDDDRTGFPSRSRRPSIALVANTAPVAFGAIAIPITTLSEITGLDKGDLGAMVGRQTPVPRADRAADPDRHGRRRAAASGRPGRWPSSAASPSRSASSRARTTSRSS